jgi:hypothetical protein
MVLKLNSFGYDITMNILGMLNYEDSARLSMTCKEFNGLVKNNAFLKEITFKKKVDKKLLTQHSSTLENLTIPTLTNVHNIPLPNLETLLITDVSNMKPDFSMYPKLKCLGVCDTSFPKVSRLELPTSLEFFYTTYQLTESQISHVNSSCKKLQVLFVYYPTLKTVNIRRGFNSDRKFMEAWSKLEDNIFCRKCLIESLYLCESEDNSSLYDEGSDISDDELGDYDYRKYHEDYDEFDDICSDDEYYYSHSD